ncbi:hypothetical protein [uncultured Winogradskyella sp.]|uniref:hypothetical protein n=1 Tax=uncultured Winogradskyella sp. TaxID=395353 RepID=UPI002612A4CC|nr:hypothetical protein [uncultured Winogradskyella sp.]
MSLEEENKKKRKEIPLTTEEWLTFFFFPFQSKGGFMNTHDLNKMENERFEKYGFEKKIEQASQVRILGIFFYVVTMLFIISIING